MSHKRSLVAMGSTKRKNIPHSLPPIPANNAGLSVTLSNRSSLIPGSPAPMAMKEEANLNRRKTRGSSRDIPPSPTITLSQYWDESDEKNSSDPDGGAGWGNNIHDSVIEVHSVGGNSQPPLNGHHRSSKSAVQLSKRPNTSWSTLSASSLAEVHKSVMERNSASGVLNPPPRVISIQDGHGHNVMTEFVGPITINPKQADPKEAKQEGISSKYSPLKPIQKKNKESRKK